MLSRQAISQELNSPVDRSKVVEKLAIWVLVEGRPAICFSPCSRQYWIRPVTAGRSLPRQPVFAPFEPAIELFAGEGCNGIGPLIMGREILKPAKRLRWDLGVIFGISGDSPGLTIKTAFEYAF